MKTSTILVTGATGQQGGAVARELLRRGHFGVRALVRDPRGDTAVELEHAGAALFVGNFDDRASLDVAVAGADGVFSVQSTEDGIEAEIFYGQAIADAAKAAGVSHFVYSSVGSAERNTRIPHFDSKFKIEEYIESIGLPATVMRPVFFFFNYEAMRAKIEEGVLPMPLKPETKLQQLCEMDYGRMVAQVFERPAENIGKAHEVASVEMTMEEVAETFSRVLERPVKYQQAPYAAFEQQAGSDITAMFHWFDHDGYRANLHALEAEFGPLTTLEDHLRARGWALSATHR